ncbi:hypothetical protein E1B28_002878 [Marasmius oreades]|uniref:Uncharacterized protein n=1 Tax=Marasmius oreades TaxID=181124 RepID=A0A9P7RPN6_9AGAR|nr:uncharacterized protein E1B28_002878 [Marasmius oreades]KAG7086961.1 hypothetical protein E1B28_002878 [Marasmius oreades]
MLIDHLGFAPGDVEMCYFDIDPPKGQGAKKCTQGQLAPTATRFKSKFRSLLSSALTGDVRFLYVDVHGGTYPDEEGSGEQDEKDEAWRFAEDENGTRQELVMDDWVGSTIRANLKSGVNLTILTSSCMGGGMLDTHTATPGVLLAGCHETQFNVKALKTRDDGVVDPWVNAITAVVRSSASNNRGIPTYTNLFNQAKKKIVNQLKDGSQWAGRRYKGPSPDETKPIPWDPEQDTSNQDPQLIFYNGFVDPDRERFLVPFLPPNAGIAKGEATRYPHDEVAHDEL